ncbi:NCS2 family permease [Bacillus hwajinpoensis]|jgi:adenine/guanine/hypoxanthine permease|uniref:NCS2 family permease n=1 Tax=Guptibacillus hwajinpoensis TaxID=208199 RepID=A0A845F677_9BACL|nr:MULTISPECIES: NCS2 family permease [Bacillaceae]MCA0993793.1 NCS2 family permease [Pseudalkalibacillus hwajinpoensis]MYL66107.1 NCS2 family permease [Pseudalkalibacillus hwajinpoensis]PFG02815.1 AGZA family xanthine/uracil permease-like MFS transporter [Bacillus sp. es.036]
MDRFFRFQEHNTTYRKETIAGLTTFLSMAYILFVNPAVLADAGMDQGAVFTATALAAALGTLIMGVLAGYPIALAPGMGLNAFFTYSVVTVMGVPWETALAGVLVSGIIFIIITIFKIREMIINAIPMELKYAAASGIGLFIAFIGLQSAGIVQNNDSTLVQLGNLLAGPTLLAVFGLIITVILMVRNVTGGIFYGMVITAIVGMIFNQVPIPDGIVGSVPSLEPTFGVAFGHLGDLLTIDMLVVVLTFLFVDFFDTAGTLIAVATQAGIMKDNKLPRAGKALFADSSATVLGAVLGTSTTTAYIESSSGVAAGGRTGFTSVVTAGFFLLALFFSPLLAVVTPSVTAPVLIIVGVLMVSVLGNIEWKRFEIAVPAFLTIIAMPLTYSIATGIALGFVMYPITMVVKGEGKNIHPIMYGLFFVFIAYFVFLA